MSTWLLAWLNAAASIRSVTVSASISRTPPTLAPNATPTPHTVLLGSDAISPAHLW